MCVYSKAGVVIWITMWTEEVLNGIFAVEGQGNIANFVDNWRSCGRVLTKFLEGWNVPTTTKTLNFGSLWIWCGSRNF